MIKITIPGRPISKSNFKLHNIHGQAWMPAKGKHSKYLAYENMIAGYINQKYQKLVFLYQTILIDLHVCLM